MKISCWICGESFNMNGKQRAIPVHWNKNVGEKCFGSLKRPHETQIAYEQMKKRFAVGEQEI